MAQVKKPEVKAAILVAAFDLFSEHGYQATSMPAIASKAGITPGNIYRYYRSKFELFYDVLDPWLDDQFADLERSAAQSTDNREKLRTILTFMWIELPRADNNFALNLMEALATKKPDEPYSRELLQASKDRVGTLLDAAFPTSVTGLFETQGLTHLIFMCHDGFVLNTRLPDDSGVRETIEQFLNAVFGPTSK